MGNYAFVRVCAGIGGVIVKDACHQYAYCLFYLNCLYAVNHQAGSFGCTGGLQQRGLEGNRLQNPQISLLPHLAFYYFIFLWCRFSSGVGEGGHGEGRG